MPLEACNSLRSLPQAHWLKGNNLFFSPLSPLVDSHLDGGDWLISPLQAQQDDTLTSGLICNLPMWGATFSDWSWFWFWFGHPTDPKPFCGSVHQSRQPPSGANEATWCDWSYDFVVLPFPFSPPPINTYDPTNMSHWTTLDWVWTNISPLQLFFFGNFQLITAFWVVTVRITAEEKKRRWDHFFLDIILIQISKVFPASLCDFLYNMKKEKAERVE